MYLLIRLMKAPTYLAIPVDSTVLDGLKDTISAAQKIGGGLSRSRRVPVDIYRDAETYSKLGKAKVVPTIGTDSIETREAVIYADPDRATVTFQTMTRVKEGGKVTYKRSTGSVGLHIADLHILLGHAMRAEFAEALREDAEAGDKTP